MTVSYAIKKTIKDNGPVFVTDGGSEILEYKKREKGEDMVNILNSNSDLLTQYELIVIGQHVQHGED